MHLVKYLNLFSGSSRKHKYLMANGSSTKAITLLIITTP